MPRGVVAEFPFYGERVAYPLHAQYMVLATTHWMPLVNGYSDYIPPDFRETAFLLDSFPSTDTFAVLQKLRVRYVGVHWDMYGPRAEAVRKNLEDFAQHLRPLSSDTQMSLRDRVVSLTARRSSPALVSPLRGRSGGGLLLGCGWSWQPEPFSLARAFARCSLNRWPWRETTSPWNGAIPRPRQAAIVFRGAKHALHVVLGFRERDVVDELVFVESGALLLPPHHTALSGVIAGERVVGATKAATPAVKNTGCQGGCWFPDR